VLIALVGQALAEGRPWTNAELPGPLPARRPDAADDFHENGMRVINEAMADLLGLSLTLDLARKTEGFD